MNEYRILKPVQREALMISVASIRHEDYAVLLNASLVLESGILDSPQEMVCSITRISNDKKPDGLLFVELVVISTNEVLEGVISREKIEGGYGLLSTSQKESDPEEGDFEETLFFNHIRRIVRTFRPRT